MENRAMYNKVGYFVIEDTGLFHGSYRKKMEALNDTKLKREAVQGGEGAQETSSQEYDGIVEGDGGIIEVSER
jgi:hypothetical protein